LRPSGNTAGQRRFCAAKAAHVVLPRENFTSEVLTARYLVEWDEHPINLDMADQKRRAKMAWKAPKIVEVPVGMEINMYACAARK
jgi:coenzyme PQQ precursor peptide PqqA